MAPNAGSSCSYTVVAGDTLSKIAASRGTTVDALLRLNPAITNPDRILVGQTLNVCASGSGSNGGSGSSGGSSNSGGESGGALV